MERSPARRQIDSWETAEDNAAQWMRHWGYLDARVTARGSDSGIDVRASRALAQVKFEARQVGRPQVQNLVGARGRDHKKRLMFFTGAGFARPAVLYADEMEVALFVYGPWGEMAPVNEMARRVFSDPSSQTNVDRRTKTSTEDFDYTLQNFDPSHMRDGDVILSPGDGQDFDYSASIGDVSRALRTIHGRGGRKPESKGMAITITPSWVGEYSGLISITAALRTVNVGRERVVRVSWSTQSQARSPGVVKEVASDAHRAAERANNLLAHLLGV